jgi:hypothetical protein
MKTILLFLFLLLGTTDMFAQSEADSRKDSLYRQEVRETIALDYTMPDYSVKKIDEAKMGLRLSALLTYLEKYQNNSYINPWIASIVKEQHKALKDRYFEVEKLKLVSVSKSGNEITVRYNVSPVIKIDNPGALLLTFHFTEGVSESKNINDLFSYIGHYVHSGNR